MANITVDIKKKSIDIGSNLVAIGKGGMNPGVYDPQEIKADAFDMDNMVDGVDKHYLTTEQIEEFEAKQDALTAGDNIDITNNVISATDTTYTAGDGISIDENNVITNTRVSAEWGCIQGDIEDQADLQVALSCKQDVLTAGDNVQIENNVISATDTTYESCDFDIKDLADSCSCRQKWNAKQNALTAGDNIDITNNVISATDTTYTAGEGISIDENNVISNTQTSAEWGNIEGDIEDQADLQAALDAKQDTLTAGDNIDITNGVISATGVVPNDATITIQKNSVDVDSFTTNQATNKTINITVPTQASDIGALPDTTKYAANLDLSINSSTYVITAQLKDQDGNNLGTQRTIDLPLESVVVDGEYDAANKKIILTLENGNTIEFSVADLVSGLQTEITSENMLDADLVDDTTASHKFVTATEKSCISTAVQPGDLACYAQCSDIPTDNCQLSNGCGYTTCTGTLVESDLQPYAKSCDLCAVATSGKYCDLDGRVTDNCQIANSCGFTTCTGTLVASDIENLAQCCDIPTDNCQLNNGCGYTTCTGTLVACDLEPYAKSCDLCAVATSGKYCDLDGRVTDNCQIGNSCGYTTCTGTLVASDIENLAQCCDIPTDNCQLDNGCGYTTCNGTVTDSDLECYVQCCDMSAYQTKDCMVCTLQGADNDHYPTAKTVADAISGGGFGDMLKSVYDPNNCNDDAFDYNNFYNTPTIPTDNCQLANSCGFTTCTGTLVACDIANLAKCCDVPTDNCQLANSCGYTTCTGTLVACDIANLAKCCDVPTDNCQLANSCGYISGISCSDVTSALGYTPYNCTNPAGYTTCTGTLVASDIECLAQCCDIPTDNCQLANGCDYATCCYVNDSINSVTAYYITKDAQGNQFATHAELSAATTFYSGGQTRVPTKNDYTIVLADEDHDDATTRYIYNSSWEFQYVVNETALTQAQLDALNSGITCTKVNRYDNCMAQCCDIPTDNCQLSNGCGYITGISCSDVTSALGYTPYDSTNPNGYTTCTGTLVASDIECLAQCCDIPTDNCQLANGCGYTTCTGTLSTCSDITTALGFTPYSAANPNGYTSCTGTVVASDLTPYAKTCDLAAVATSGKYCDLSGRVTDNCQIGNSCGYTTCTGTLVQSDIQNLAQCCDIPTDNCQLANSCGYTTCTGTLQSCDIACINGCCLTSGGNVCLDGLPSQTGCCGKYLATDGCNASWEDVPSGGIQMLPGSPVTQCYVWIGTEEEYCCLGTYRTDTEYKIYD